MNYMLPVKNPYRHGRGFGAMMWYGIHRGVDFLPGKPWAKDSVYGASDGRVTEFIGGACHGFDWVDNNGRKHRYCHVQTKLRPGDTFKRGDKVATMVSKGLLLPRGSTHLHWVVWDINGRLIDPMTLPMTNDKTLRAEAKKLFKNVWKREPATGDLNTVFLRWKHEGWSKAKFLDYLKYWYSQVWRNGELHEGGNKKWQRHKNRIQKKYGSK